MSGQSVIYDPEKILKDISLDHFFYYDKIAMLNSENSKDKNNKMKIANKCVFHFCIQLSVTFEQEIMMQSAEDFIFQNNHNISEYFTK